MSKLKPCPFCGSSEDVYKDLINYEQWTVCCQKCDYEISLFEKECEAENAWNNRPVEDELRITIDKLTQENKKLIVLACEELAREADCAILIINQADDIYLLKEHIEELKKEAEL